MSCDLQNGHLEPCKNNIGGLKALYVVKFNELPSDEITIIDDIIVSIGNNQPTAYKFDLVSSVNTFTENQVGNSEGLISFSSLINFRIKKSSYFNQGIVKDLIKNRYKIILEYNNGNIRLIGKDNGVIFSQNNTSGTGLSTFEGYDIKGEALEGDMSPFILDIEGLGFDIVIGDEPPTPPNLNSFITEWRVIEAGDISNFIPPTRTIYLPLLPVIPGFDPDGGTYSGTIDWGDGVVEDFNYNNRTHTYLEDGDYTVTITGEIEGFTFGYDNISCNNLINVKQWGVLRFDTDYIDFGGVFEGCINMNITAIDKPNTDGKTQFEFMFSECSSLVWNSSANNLDVSSAVNIRYMFYKCDNFNQDLNDWDVSNVTDMSYTFRNLSFNGDISSWDTSSVINLTSFASVSFNRYIGDWDVSNVQRMVSCFGSSTSFGGDPYSGIPFVFNQPIGDWDVSSCYLFNNMFLNNIAFNQPIGEWDMTGTDQNSVTLSNITSMFENATSFNQNINNWDVTNFNSLQYVFLNASSFNQPLDQWDTSNCQTFKSLFKGSNFNQNINNWNLTNANRFEYMFSDCPFNQPLDQWSFNPSNNLIYTNMFADNVVFNQPISSWGYTSLNPVYYGMFSNAIGFNQDISSFLFNSSVIDVRFLMQGKDDSNYDPQYYDALLESIDVNFNGSTIKELDMGCCKYTTYGETFRNNLIAKGWTIIDCGLVTPPPNVFSTIWRTTTNNETIVLPLKSTGVYNATVDWGDGVVELLSNANKQHTYSLAGDYNVVIDGQVEGFNFNLPLPTSPDPRTQIIEVTNWGTNLRFEVSTTVIALGGYFKDCVNLDITATDVPNLDYTYNLNGMFSGCASLVWNSSVNNLDVSSITNTPNMFRGCVLFNQDLDQWNMSNVNNLVSMFKGASSFNGNISTWDVSNVGDMSNMFAQAYSFNNILNDWETTSLTRATKMFEDATNFNQEISLWDVSLVTDMSSMFKNAVSFNSYITNWDTSSVEDMSSMFMGATSFNRDLLWVTTSVTTMRSMFEGATSFAGSVTDFQPLFVTDMSFMFKDSNYNQPLDTWNTSNLTNMSGMFQNSPFNQPIDNFITSSVIYMSNLFNGNTQFNQPLDNWDTSSVLIMSNIFRDATSFDQSLVNWSFSSCTNFSGFMAGKTNNDYSSTNYCLLLANLAGTFTYYNMTLDMGTIRYEEGPCKNNRDIMTDIKNWTINDGGVGGSSLTVFEFTVPSNGYTIFLPYSPTGTYSGSMDISYLDAGGNLYTETRPNTYANRAIFVLVTSPTLVTIEIDGGIDGFSFYENNDTSSFELTKVNSLSSSFVINKGAFFNCQNLTKVLSTSDAFIGSDLSRCFEDCGLLDEVEGIGFWDTTSVTNMSRMFNGCGLFNQPLKIVQPGLIGEWDTSNVTDMSRMFMEATSFNQDISYFDFSSICNSDCGPLEAFMLGKDETNYDVTYYDNLLQRIYDTIPTYTITPTDDSSIITFGDIKSSVSSAPIKTNLYLIKNWQVQDGGII